MTGDGRCGRESDGETALGLSTVDGWGRTSLADGSGHFAPETADDVGKLSWGDVVMGASGGILVQVERV